LPVAGFFAGARAGVRASYPGRKNLRKNGHLIVRCALLLKPSQSFSLGGEQACVLGDANHGEDFDEVR
jgi:hypothetical protein